MMICCLPLLACVIRFLAQIHGFNFLSGKTNITGAFSTYTLLRCVELRFYCLEGRVTFGLGGSGGGFLCTEFSIFMCSSFPWRATSSVHIRLHVVQHISQCVFDHSSPAHVTHRLVLYILRRVFEIWPKID